MDTKLDNRFVFDLGDRVRVVQVDDEGVIIARTEYVNRSPLYKVAYRSSRGKPIEKWLLQSDINVA